MSLDRLPLFPLPVVLFPGTSLPLHIFERRYRQLLSDCLAGDRQFGIVCRQQGAPIEAPRPGTIGCVAEIVSTEQLADERSNIVVRGTRRFELVALIESATAYHVCRGRAYDDESRPDDDLTTLAARVRDVFERVGRAARALSDDPDPIPALPKEPELLAFAIAALIDLDLDARQGILASRSPAERLQRLDALLTPALSTLGARAHVHTLAKTNGRGTHVQP